MEYGTMHWVSRDPRPLPPATSLLRIYTPNCWGLIFLCLVLISIFMVVAAKLGCYYGVGTPGLEELVLFPFG